MSNRKKHKAPYFKKVKGDVLKNAKWRKLTSKSKVVWIYLLSKCIGTSNKPISLTYSELGDMMSSQTICKAFKELEAAGFIRKTKNGGLYGGISQYRVLESNKKQSKHFVMVTLEMLNDPEWRKLSNKAKIVWVYMRSKFNYTTWSTVTLTYAELEDMMSSKTICKAFRELEKTSFIKKTKRGGLHRGASRYKFIGPYRFFYHNGVRI